VRRVQRLGHLGYEVKGAPWIEPTFPPEQLAKVGALDVGHREIEQTVLVTRGHGRNDVWVVEARGNLRLAQEALPKPFVTGEFGGQNLQSDAAACCNLLCEIDGAHRPFANE
jgi:hypothetical protein